MPITYPGFRRLHSHVPNYYIDPVNGSDSNIGTSLAKAFQTCVPVNNLTLKPGQTVYLATTGAIRGPLNLNGNGTAALPVVLAAAPGSSGVPVLTASDDVSSLTWSAAGGGAPAGAYQAQCAATVEPLNGARYATGFESNEFATDFSAPTVSGTCTIAVQGTTVYGGTHAVKVTFDGTANVAWASRTLLQRNPVCSVRCMFQLGAGFSWGSGVKSVTILSGHDTVASATYRWRLEVVGDATSYHWLIMNEANTTVYGGTTGEIVAGQWYCLEALWQAGTGSNGGITFFVDGAQKGSLLTDSLAGQGMNLVRLGAQSTGGAIVTAGATMCYDDLVIGTEYRGTRVGGILGASGPVWLNTTTILPLVAAPSALTPGTCAIDATTNTLYVMTATQSDPTGTTLRLSQPMGGALLNVLGTYTQVNNVSLQHSTNSLGMLSTLVANTTVQHCTFVACVGAAIFSEGASLLVQDCAINWAWNGISYPSETGEGIYLFGTGCNNALLQRNVISNCSKGVHTASGVKNPVVFQNVIVRAKVNGMTHEGSDAANPMRFYHNTVIHSPDPGGAAGHGFVIQVGGTGGLTAKNNLVYSDYTATATNVQCAAIGAYGYAAVDYDYNLYWVTGASTAFIGKLTVQEDFPTWQADLAAHSYGAGAGLGGDLHSLNADPLLVNVGAGNYALQGASPARGAAVLIPGYDIPGQNIGAF